jgi:hypothetical protein
LLITSRSKKFFRSTQKSIIMRKISTLFNRFTISILFVGAFVINANSQVYLSEDFETPFTGTPEAPSGWSQTRITHWGDDTPTGITVDAGKDWEQNTWTGSAWIQKGSNIAGKSAQEQFGFSVSMSSDGNTVAVGAVSNFDNGVGAGQLRIYEWNGSNWTQKGQDINGEAGGNYFGISVSISSDGNTVASGATGNDNSNGTNAGHTFSESDSVRTWVMGAFEEANDLEIEIGRVSGQLPA